MCAHLTAARNKKIVESIDNVNFTHWDLVLAFDNISLLKIKPALQRTNVPVVFLSADHRPSSQPILIRNLLMILSATYERMPFISGVPIHYVHKPISHFSHKTIAKSKKQAEVNALLLFDKQHMNDVTLASIIHFTNVNAGQLRLTVFLKSDHARLIKPSVNSNVRLKSLAAFSHDQIPDYDLAFASGDSCLLFAQHGIPTFVTGVRGFGGLLTAETLEEHVQWNFQGRIGGEVGEEIPYWILHDEFQSFKTSQNNRRKQMGALARKVKHLSHPARIFAAVEQKLTELNRLSKQVNSKKSGTLIPKLTDGVHLFASQQDQTYRIANNLGVVLGVASKNEKNILDQCNGNQTIQAIAVATHISEQDVTAFITELWHDHIVKFVS